MDCNHDNTGFGVIIWKIAYGYLFSNLISRDLSGVMKLEKVIVKACSTF